MSTQKTTPIVATTAAKQSVFEVDDVPARLTAVGLTGAETIPLYAMDGGVPTPVTKDGVAVELTATAPGIAIIAPGDYRVDKGVTVGAVSVNLVQSS